MEQFLGLDYPTWWFLVVGAVFSGYAILDGFDLGAGSLHLFFKKDESRRIALNAVGPVWDGNEVWLVIGGGTLFAGFPVLYGSLLSAFYFPFILFLVFLILRAISIEFRSKEPMRWWRQTWDVLYAVSSVGLAFLLSAFCSETSSKASRWMHSTTSSDPSGFSSIPTASQWVCSPCCCSASTAASTSA